MLTQAAVATIRASADPIGVYTRPELVEMGCTRSEITARIAAGRWRPLGRAVVTHNGELTREQRWRAGVLSCGPRAVLASFSAAEYLGLQGWTRAEIHVLAPAYVRIPRVAGLPIVLHRLRAAEPDVTMNPGRCQPIAPALVLAARAFQSPRPACGVLAAGVQQRLATAGRLRVALAAVPHGRHQGTLRAALDDIAMGAEALSEIDFVRLCRRNGLPAPTRQAVRVEPSGRRRYLDAEWRLASGRHVVAEVDGAVHLAPRRWFDDQLRQNELVLSGSLVLRFPSVIVRTEPQIVVTQLRRALAAR